ncbi:uncharacterized protein KD926_008296 [Aspergillus affinis]|uniref:uncharacterized protein n=1 Tax=Aspergillus affinis TaxID=1070780 RepID=UPI0022FDD7E9|nr:uncharacterized protein KD926_008296 [Aspergillus affinis]KAI9040339.1 hypothetical protein KD926_008296 [Aspergillus affinis]
MSSTASVPADPWTEAFETLDPEDQKRLNKPDTSLLGILESVRNDADSRKEICRQKGWKVGENKHGEKVTLRHALEKVSVWVKETIKVVDVVVSMDKSGQAALPWAAIKFLISVIFRHSFSIGTNDIALFTNITEAVETIARLIARYTVFEKLYLHEDCETVPKLRESLRELYAGILRYLSKAKDYFTGNCLKRFGRGLLDMLRKEYDELWSKINETEVEKWAKLVDAELNRKKAKQASQQHDRLKTILHDMERPIMQITDQLAAIQDKLNSWFSLLALGQMLMILGEERVKVFHWISRIEYRKHHEELSKGVLPGSGEWLLRSPEYIHWGQSSVSSILWLHGIPGSGKTKLVSTVINSIQQHSTAPVAYFYCNRSNAEGERSMPREIIRAILRQLASSDPDVPIKEPVVREYESRKKHAEKDGSSLSELAIEDCTKLIREITKSNPATIIIDALDECDQLACYELLDALHEIVAESEEVVKVFVSSRDDVDVIGQSLEKCGQIPISPSQNGGDIRRFIDTELDRLIKKRLLLRGRISKDLRKKVIKTLNKGAQGMFRWVALSLELLQRQKFEPDFRNVLGRLPPALSGLYDEVYKGIESSGVHGHRTAVRALQWLLCAQRLLSVRELLAAISMGLPGTSDEESSSKPYLSQNSDSSSESDLDDEAYSAKGSDYDIKDGDSLGADVANDQHSVTTTDILQLCQNLVIVDSQLSVFRFAHLSVREYLQTRPEFTEVELHSLAMKGCMDVYMTEANMNPAHQEALKSYGMFFWPVHYKTLDLVLGSKCTLEQLEQFLPFFLQGEETSLSYVTWAREITSQFTVGQRINSHLRLDRNNPLGIRLEYAASTPATPLKAACAFGLAYLAKKFGSLSDSNVNESRFQLPQIAASEGQNEILHWLLEKGVEVDIKDYNGEVPLCRAASRGHLTTVMLLVEQGVDLERREDPQRMTPLLCAVKGSHHDIVKYLLQAGANVETKDRSDWTPLIWAVNRGNKPIVDVLLKHGADLEASPETGFTALFHAVFEEDVDMIHHLLDHGADIEANDRYDRTPLFQALLRGQQDMMQLLLKKGANTETRAEDGWTPLTSAAMQPNEPMAMLLLQAGANIEAKEEDGWTPLFRAISQGNEGMVELLVKHGANVDAKDKDGETPRSLARVMSEYELEDLLD